MNLILHGIALDSPGGGIRFGDTLGPAGEALPNASLMLTNPPFGTKTGGGLPTRTDLKFPTSNKQFAFLQHIYTKLIPGGRAAVVLPDNVLFEGNIGKQIRTDLMSKCNLHTILRLPTGIFYAQGVKTNVLFFTRAEASNTAPTKAVWVYDLRASMPHFGRRTALTREHFTDFEAAFGDDPRVGEAAMQTRTDTGEGGRFRKFSRESIAANEERLDLNWLEDENQWVSGGLSEPVTLAQEAVEELDAALHDLRSILIELGEELEA
jgi:type I restriction enzyme M protein